MTLKKGMEKEKAMAKGWDEDGISSDDIRKVDEKKGTHYKAPGDRVSYIKKGVIKMFIPRDGTNKIRIIQPLETRALKFYTIDVYFHRGIGDEGEEWFGDYLCNERMKAVLKAAYPDDPPDMPGKCFRCQQQTSELWDTNSALAKTYYPTRRKWCLVNDLKASDPDEVLLWSAPWTLIEEITSRSTNAETQVYVDVSHPTRGVPITFERTGKGERTKYTNVQLFTTPTKLSKEMAEQRIEFREAMFIPSYEQVKAAELNIPIEDVMNAPRSDGSDDDDSTDSIPTDEDVSTSKKAKEPDKPKMPECFGKEYDKWQDCDTCEFADPCSKPPEKQEKPKRLKPSRSEKPRQEDQKEPNGDDSEKKSAIRQRIIDAQKNKQEQQTC